MTLTLGNWSFKSTLNIDTIKFSDHHFFFLCTLPRLQHRLARQLHAVGRWWGPSSLRLRPYTAITAISDHNLLVPNRIHLPASLLSAALRDS
jgi:hypothetical protein